MRRNYLMIILILATLGMVVIPSMVESSDPRLRNWQIYTNTTHIHDIIEVDNKIYQATWGGLEVFDIASDDFTKTYTGFDGLQDLNIKSIAYLSSSQTIMLGTGGAGVNRLWNGSFQIPINKTIGLPEDNVNLVANSDSLLFVATGEGLTVFKDVPDFPYPLPINHYATHNGLVSKNITSLALFEDSHLFVGTDKGLNYVPISRMFDAKEWKLLDSANTPLLVDYITSCAIYNNTVAIGTRNGAARAKIDMGGSGSRVDGFTEWEVFIPQTDPIASEKVYAVYLDSNLNMWLSYGIWNDNILIIEETEDIAVTKISPGNDFTNWEIAVSGLNTSQIRGFKEIKGKMYVYSWGEGLFFLENDYWHNRKSDTMAANNITDISVDREGKVWVCNGSIGGEAQRRGNPGVSGFDGESWTIFRAADSPLIHDRVFRITTDARNRKWFGTWNFGLSVYDEDNDLWYNYNRNNGLPANEIGALTTDNDNNIWISAYSGGVVILDLDAIEDVDIPVKKHFHLYSPNSNFSDVINIYPTGERTYLGGFYSGIRIWDAPGFPQTRQPGDAWKKPPPPSLSDGFVYIYGIDSRDTHWGKEVWIASENGLFMHDTYNERWYRYGTGIKRELWANGSWQRDRLYFVDEERLYGAAPTFPTALFVDDFDRIWIGTETNGLTVYDFTTDRYSLLNTKNSPLLSDNITALGYEPFSGKLYIGTDKGLNSVEIGKRKKRDDPQLTNTVVYPNPFYPDKVQHLTIANKDAAELTILPQGENECRIYNVNGELIITLEENRYFEFSWDGRNDDGKKCSSGIYYYVVSSPDGQTQRGTIVLIR